MPSDVHALLRVHGLEDASEQPFEHTGFSGAMLTRLERADGRRFVLKHMSIDRDWIMRATNDSSCREAMFAGVSSAALGGMLRAPMLGAAREGDAHCVLMDDISDRLLPARRVTDRQLDSIISRMAELHALPAPSSAVPWCGIRERLMLLTPETAHIAEAYGAPVAADITAGWDAFDRLASPTVVSLVRRLFAEPAPLLAALATMPPAFLHGDLKFDNIGLDGEERIWLIDWAMTLIAPPAVELGWFLAINSRRLPVTLEDVMQRYAAAAGMPVDLRRKHDALTVLCGLILRGWRKALDAAEGEPDELAWWCERAGEAASFL